MLRRPITPAALLVACIALFANANAIAGENSNLSKLRSDWAVGPQYDFTHVYVAPEELDRFVASFVGTFGGTTSKKVVTTITPTPSETTSQFVQSPVGPLSVFGFKTPIPYPFGAERTGYLVADLDAALRAAQSDGVNIIVAPFPDPIGRDAVIQWSGGVNMQVYWHTTAPSCSSLKTIRENRVYLSTSKADEFVEQFIRFSNGRIASDNAHAPGVEIGRPTDTYRLIRIESLFGKLRIIVTDGHLPYPYGRELTGYEVANLAETLHKATMNGAAVLIAPYTSGARQAAMVRFPGGYIAEIHTPNGK